jgi:ABC-type glycerol-3-phosphate transport system substrate-binding protein
VTIEIVTRSGVASPTGHSQFYAQRARSVFTPATDITVEFVDAQPNVGEKLSILAAAGTLPDGAWFGVVADGNAGREQAAKGIFKPLDDLARRDQSFDLKPYFAAMLDAFSVEGKLYALPTHAHYGTNVLYYNRNLTRAAGVTIPEDGNWTLDQLVEAAQKLTDRGADQWGFWPGWGFSEFGAFWVRTFGGEFLDEAGERSLIDSPQARQAFEWVHAAQARHQLIDDLFREVQGAPLNLGGARGLFALGKLAMHAATPGLVAEYKKPGTDEVRFDVGIALMPTGPGGRRGTQVSGSGMGITGTAKQEATWEWLKFVTDRENGVEQVFGGAGSPGGRTDVWNDPRLLTERDPIYAATIRAFPQGAGSLRLPANFRYAQVVNAVNAELTPYFQGQASLQDATSKAVQAANNELAQR